MWRLRTRPSLKKELWLSWGRKSQKHTFWLLQKHSPPINNNNNNKPCSPRLRLSLDLNWHCGNGWTFLKWSSWVTHKNTYRQPYSHTSMYFDRVCRYFDTDSEIDGKPTSNMLHTRTLATCLIGSKKLLSADLFLAIVFVNILIGRSLTRDPPRLYLDSHLCRTNLGKIQSSLFVRLFICCSKTWRNISTYITNFFHP